MKSLKITDDTRHSHLVEFCGDKLLSFTGVTFIITSKGKEKIELRDEIKKDDNGNFTLIKSEE